MYCYQLSPHVYLEIFKQEAVLLIADRDVMVTVNLAAAKLYECARKLAGDGDFSRFDCVHFLLETYDMSEQEAKAQMRSILGFGLKQRLVLKKAAV